MGLLGIIGIGLLGGGESLRVALERLAGEVDGDQEVAELAVDVAAGLVEGAAEPLGPLADATEVAVVGVGQLGQL